MAVTSATGTISSPGIGSSLDVNSIVSQLMAVESQPLTTLAQKESGLQSSISALGSLKGALSAFQVGVAGLADPSTFQTLSARAGDTGVLSATTGPGAVSGSYSLNVSKLAQAQSIYSGAQASADSAIGTGASTTIQFEFGSVTGGSLSGGQYTGAGFSLDPAQAAGSVTIDSSNNTLAGIRDAINTANVGVTATIVNDGGTTPYHLVLTSAATGAKSSMKISVSGDASLSNLLSYDASGTQRFTQSAAAQDATLTMNGIAVTSASNSVSGAVQGVTLNLLGTGATTVSVTRDSSSLQAAVQGFVNGYNSANSTIASLTSYDPTTRQAGPLLGDATVQRIQAAMRGMFNSPIASGSTLTVMSQAGITFQKDGSLAIDATKLQAAINSDPDGLARLFCAAARPSDALVSAVNFGPGTTQGNHLVNVTAIATRGIAAGSVALGPSTVIDGSNDQLTVNLDGVAATVSLAQGSYTPDQVAALVQSSINGTAAFSAAGRTVSVSQSGGVLSLLSSSYGSASYVNVTGGSGFAALFGSVGNTQGTDVAGTIDGISATGTGQLLTAQKGSSADGLLVQVNGGATGPRGTILFTRGYADQLNTLLDGFLQDQGILSGRTDGLQSSIADIEDQKTRFNQHLTDVEARYRAQFSALDTMISSLNQTSSFLTQQLANLPTIGK